MSYVRFHHPPAISNEALIRFYVNSVNLKAKWYDVQCPSNETGTIPRRRRVFLDSSLAIPLTLQNVVDYLLDNNSANNSSNNSNITGDNTNESSCIVDELKHECILPQTSTATASAPTMSPPGTAYVLITIQCIQDLRKQQTDLLQYVLQHVSDHIQLLVICCPEDPLITFSRINNQRTEELQKMQDEFVNDWSTWYKQIQIQCKKTPAAKLTPSSTSTSTLPHSIQYIFLPDLLQARSAQWNSQFLHLQNEAERVFYCVQWALSQLPDHIMNSVIGWYTTQWCHFLPCLTNVQQHTLVKHGSCYFDYTIPRTDCNERKQFVAGFIC